MDNIDFVYKMKNISKKYDTKTVLQIEDLAIREGEIFCLVGPSGAGKSTLLRIMNFIETTDTGEIFFWGINTHPDKLHN